MLVILGGFLFIVLVVVVSDTYLHIGWRFSLPMTILCYMWFVTGNGLWKSEIDPLINNLIKTTFSPHQ